MTCFASNIHRVQQVVDAAAALDRRVSLIGRSMRKNTNIGRMLGHIDIPDGMLVGPKEIEDFPDEQLVVISTGSQGEPLSALRRMAHGDHPNVELHDGDTVIFSATPIPGNERAVNETIDRIYRLGANVITPADVPVHASGHGYAEELKLMINLTHPRYVMPVHGDHKRLRLHGELAEAVGVPPKSIFRGENGLPLEIDSSGAHFGEREQAGLIFVDGVEVGDIEDVALRDRRMLSADGIFIVVATISEQDGRSVVPPEIIFRGVPFVEESDAFVDELRAAVDDSLAHSAEEEITEIDLVQDHLHDDVAEFVYKPPQAAPDDPAGRRRGLALGNQRAPEPARAHSGRVVVQGQLAGEALPARRERGDIRHAERSERHSGPEFRDHDGVVRAVDVRVGSGCDSGAPLGRGGGVVLGGRDRHLGGLADRARAAQRQGTMGREHHRRSALRDRLVDQR